MGNLFVSHHHVEHSIEESKFLMSADDIKLFKAIERPNDVFEL